MEAMHVVGLVGKEGGLVWDRPVTLEELDYVYDHCVEDEWVNKDPAKVTEHPLCQYLLDHGCKEPLDGRTSLCIRVLICVVLYLPSDEFTWLEFTEPGHYLYYPYRDYPVQLLATDEPPEPSTTGCRVPLGENYWQTMANWYRELHPGTTEEDFWEWTGKVCQAPVIPDEVRAFVSSLQLSSTPKYPIDAESPLVRIDWYQYFEDLEKTIKSQRTLSDDEEDRLLDLKFKYWDEMIQD